MRYIAVRVLVGCGPPTVVCSGRPTEEAAALRAAIISAAVCGGVCRYTPTEQGDDTCYHQQPKQACEADKERFSVGVRFPPHRQRQGKRL